MSDEIFLGVDTSNYTTSLSAVSAEGKVIANIKRLLPVAIGERGLRQSDAVFAHIKAVPALMRELSQALSEYSPSDARNIAAVGFSSAPRDADGSYMPCFLVGEAVASSVASVCGVPLISSSHQSGHIMAALYSSDSLDLLGKEFAAFHVSGGTFEVLLCRPHEKYIFEITEIGKSIDITAGQAIDRVGVMMGMSFPCGAELERKALEYTGEKIQVKTCVKDLQCNLSGLENKARELYNSSGSVEKTAAYVFEFVTETLERMSDGVRNAYPDIPIVYSGGVMSSTIIKNRLAKFTSRFAEAGFSSDNAAGCALLCREKFMRMKESEAQNG